MDEPTLKELESDVHDCADELKNAHAWQERAEKRHEQARIDFSKAVAALVRYAQQQEKRAAGVAADTVGEYLADELKAAEERIAKLRAATRLASTEEKGG